MSKSNVRYIATIAFAQAITQIMAREYQKKEGRDKFKKILLDLYVICDNIVINHKEKITPKEAYRVKKAVEIMNEYGLENASSYKTYISFLIAVVSERLTELSKSKKFNPKIGRLQTISDRLVVMYDYFDIRLKNEQYDADALKLLNNFNELF